MVGFGLYFGACTDEYASTPCLVSVLDPLVAVDSAPGGEIGSFYIVHQLRYRQIGVIDERDRSIDSLCKVVWRHIGGHTYGYTGSSVDEQIGETSGKHHRLATLVVIVRLEIHRLRVDIGHHGLAHLLEPHLGVTHRRRAVTVDGAEVSMPLYQAVPHGPRLCQTHHSAVNRRIAMGVIVTHDLAHSLGGFLERLVGIVAHLVHTEKHTAVNRFESVTHIGQGTRHYNRHRIIDVG